MKRGLVVACFAIGVILIGLAVAETICEETDDGQDYYSQGTTATNCTDPGCENSTNTDSCSDNSTLIEYYCETGNSEGAEEYDCRYGCENSVCLTATCNSANLNLCWDKPLCEKAGGYWYNSICHKEAEQTENETEEDNESSSQGLGQTIRQRVKAGVYTDAQGNKIRVSELAQNRIRFRIREFEAESELEIEQETENNHTILKVKLKNGITKEIKVMPDTAAERALTRLRLKVCNESNNCTIELKDVGERNQTQLVYELQRQRHFKLLGLFGAKAQVRAQVDAETGEVIIIKKPWWAFLATEPEETEENSEE